MELIHKNIGELVKYFENFINTNRAIFDSGNLTIKTGGLIEMGWTKDEIQYALDEAEKRVTGKKKKTAIIAGIIVIVVIAILLATKSHATLGSLDQVINTENGVPGQILDFINSNGTKGSPFVVESGESVRLSKGSAENQSNLSISMADDKIDSGGSNPPAASILSPEISELKQKTRSTCEFNFISDRVIIDCDSNSLGIFLKEAFKFLKGAQ